MKTVNLWAILSVFACIIACVLSAAIDPAKTRETRSLGGGGMSKFRSYCMECGLAGNNCPPGCPGSLSYGLLKRNFQPFNDDLGNLSFEDYVFLKTLGRTKK